MDCEAAMASEHYLECTTRYIAIASEHTFPPARAIRVGTTRAAALQISNDSITYYASLVSYYSVYKLKRFPVWAAYLYLLCFVAHRYQRLHDHLLTSLMHHVRRYTEEAKTVAKDHVYTARIESNDTLHKAGHVLPLFTDDRIADATPFQDVKTHGLPQ